MLHLSQMLERCICHEEKGVEERERVQGQARWSQSTFPTQFSEVVKGAILR